MTGRDATPPELLGKLNISPEEFEKFMASLAQREKITPPLGAPAPDFELRRLDQKGALSEECLRLSSLRGRPVALAFGSYTCPYFRSRAARLNEIYRRHRDAVEFICVYIQEAHPDDGWQVPSNLRRQVIYRQHRSEAERAAAAEACVKALGLELPMLLDGLGNEVDTAYAALPLRLYAVDRQGFVAWRSRGAGPRHFDLDAWEQALKS